MSAPEPRVDSETPPATAALEFIFSFPSPPCSQPDDPESQALTDGADLRRFSVKERVKVIGCRSHDVRVT